jgi:hypothetical protein
LVKNLPNHGWLYNHFSIFGELFANAHAAITKKIENGIPGVITPMYAIPTQKKPIPM